MNQLNNIEEPVFKHLPNLLNDIEFLQYKEFQPEIRAKSTLDFNQDLMKKGHRRIQSQDIEGKLSRKESVNDYGAYPTLSKKTSVNPEVKFISQRINETVSAFDRYKNQHLQRLDTVKMSLKKHAKVFPKNEQVENEILLLKKVRQMTQQSFHTRIKTGGSLVDFSQIKPPNPNDFLLNANPQHFSQAIEQSEQINVNEVNHRMQKHFKHIPKYPLQVQQRSSSRTSRKRISLTDLSHKQILKHKHKDNRSKDQIQETQENPKSIFPESKTKDQELKEIELDRIKNLMIQLPVILAKDPHNRESIDYLYFKATNLMFSHQYSEAIDIFSQAEIQTKQLNQYQKDMIHFNKAYCYFKQDRMIDSLRIFENISFYQVQILAKFNQSIIYYLEYDYDKAFESIDYCMQQLILGFVKIDWMPIKKLKNKVYKIFKVVSSILKKEIKQQEELDEEKNMLLQKFNAYEDHIKEDAELNQMIQKISNKPSLNNLQNNKNVKQFAGGFNRNADSSVSSTSIAPSMKLPKQQQSISITSEYDFYTSTNNSPKTKPVSRVSMSKFSKGLNQFNIKPQELEEEKENNKEYFPMPFEYSKRLITSSTQEMSRYMRKNQIKEDLKKQKIIEQLVNGANYSQINISQGDSELELQLQEVSFMSQDNLEKLVFKYNPNQSAAQTQQNQSLPLDSSTMINQFKVKQDQEQVQGSQISMELLDEEIKAYQDERIDFESKFNPAVDIDPSQIEVDELGLPRVKPLYLDKENDVLLDRILGLKQGQELNEKEKAIVEKINRFQKEYMIDQVLADIEEQKAQLIVYNEGATSQENQEDKINIESEIDQRNKEFFMDNFFKVFDREPNSKVERTPESKNTNDLKAKLKEKLGNQFKKAFAKKPRTLSQAVETKSNFSANQDNSNNQSLHNRNIKQQNSLKRRESLKSNASFSKANIHQFHIEESSSSSGSEQEQTSKVFKNKLRMSEVEEVKNFIENREWMKVSDFKRINQYLKRLNFFAKYPITIRYQLMMECQLNFVEQGKRLFSQGDSSPDFYVILRGSAKAILIKKDYGNIPIAINTFYDGKEFGEVNLYEESETLDAKMVEDLNKQKYTCETMEDSFIISLEKEKTNKIINANLQANFEKRIEFLKSIDIFKGLEMHVLLPLANNLIPETYHLGEYILKEGQQPRGLYLLFSGQCKVGSEKLNMRSKTPFAQLGNKLQRNVRRNFRFKGNFHDLEAEIEGRIQEDDFKGRNNKHDATIVDTRETNGNHHSRIVKPMVEEKRLRSEKRIFQNDRIYFDENGKRIKDHIVYKDYMTFFTLTIKDYFGGRSLLIHDSKQQRVTKDVRESQDYKGDEDSDEDRNQNYNDDQVSSLSVIADSREVELLIMDRTQLSFFQENVQKEIYHRVEKAFQPDQPYESTVVEKIKDKFREWDKFKLETVSSILKQSYAEKTKASILNINR